MPTYIDRVFFSVWLWTQCHMLTARCLLSSPRASHKQVHVPSKISTTEQTERMVPSAHGKLYLPCQEKRITSPHFSQALQRKWCEGPAILLGLSGSSVVATEKVLSPLVPSLTAARASWLLHCPTVTLVCVYCLFRAILLLLRWISSAEEQMTTPDGASQAGELTLQLW